MIYIGDDKIGKLYFGDDEIGKVYLGDTLVFQKGGGGGLPVGATRCEIVFSNGYTSFINTSLVPSVNSSIETEIYWCCPLSFQSAIGFVQTSPVSRYNPISRTSSGPWEVGYSDIYSDATYPAFSVSGRVYRCKMQISVSQNTTVVKTYSQDGTLLDTSTLSYSATAPNFSWTVGLLGRKDSATTIPDGIFRGGLGRTKFYNDTNFGTLVADFDPCFYQGNFGFWDYIGQEFHTGTVPADIRGIGKYWNTEGFFPNARNINNTNNNAKNYLIDYRGAITSRLFEIPQGCTSIRFNAGNVSSSDNYALLMLKSDSTYATYFNYNSADRVVTVPNNAAYVRMSMTWGAENSCYIYDVTHSKYIWKGINVI